MNKTDMNFFRRSNDQQATCKGKTWSCGRNWRLPFAVVGMLSLSFVRELIHNTCNYFVTGLKAIFPVEPNTLKTTM